MCAYAFDHDTLHYACVECRISFKRHPGATGHSCPRCAGPRFEGFEPCGCGREPKFRPGPAPGCGPAGSPPPGPACRSRSCSAGPTR
ncbi:hypothetical protein [Streptomyces sp. Y1]|uniref:C2H2-type domain-containing protein n=1 Tax=Streptomyces sp. Y1 TaxID=3238634 RepID=A0AB39TFS7_9ACTN